MRVASPGNIFGNADLLSRVTNSPGTAKEPASNSPTDAASASRLRAGPRALDTAGGNASGVRARGGAGQGSGISARKYALKSVSSSSGGGPSPLESGGASLMVSSFGSSVLRFREP